MRTLLFLGMCSMPWLAGCTDGGGGSTGTGPHGNHGSVVVGVTSELRAGIDVKLLRVKRIAGCDVISTDDVSTDLKFPSEFRFDALPDRTPVQIELGAYAADASQTPLVTRLASTEVIAGRTLL